MFNIPTNEYLLYREFYENGVLADLSEGYEKCAGDYMKATFGSFEEKNLEPFMEEDGGLYGIAGGRYGYEHCLLWLRQDWLDASGITEMPTSLDDIENILQTWKDTPPTEDYVGMVLGSTVVAGGYSSLYSANPIFQSFGATPATWIEDESGEIIWGSTAPEMKEGLAVLADWYEKGLIDQEFATRTANGATDAVVVGSQSGAAFAPWWFGYTIADMGFSTPEAEFAIVNAPLDDEGNYNVVWPGPAGDVVVVNSEFSNPEAVIKILNVEYDMWRGFDEEAFEANRPNMESNVAWTYYFPTGGVNLEYANVIPDVGAAAAQLIEEGTMPDNYITEQASNVRMIESAAQYAETGVAEATTWLDYYARYVASNITANDEVKVTYPVYSYQTESMGDLKANLDTLEQTTFLKIITGQEPVDSFDQFVEDWYAQGGQTLVDEVKEMAK